MEHTTGRSAQPNSSEELRVSLDGLAPIQEGVPKRRFAAVLALAAALALACGLLAFFCVCQRYDYGLQLAMRLDSQAAELSQARDELAAARAELARRTEDLAQREEDLAQARDAIALLEEYSVAAPDGTVPEYATLFPDFYAPEWTGETVSGGRVCCLTFDDGPSASTGRLLEALDRHGVKATFFVVGKTGEADQQRMRDIVAAGHTLAMHSWSHDYKKVYSSVEAFLEEFDQLYHWIYEVTGTYPSVYRFPGGSINGYDRGVYQEIVAEMARRGFVYFDWNASAQDATLTPLPASAVAANCLKGVGRDLVVLLAHDGAARGTTVDALPAVIEGYQAAGYTFTALHPGVEQVTFGYPKPR